MIKEIDGLKLPAFANCTETLTDNGETKQTVNNRMITRKGTPKWELTVDFGETLLTLAYQKQFYEKCLKAKGESMNVVFINPLTNIETLAVVKCTEIKSPSILNVVKYAPTLYGGIGASFREV